MDSKYKEFYCGCFGGVVGTFMSHPIDTVRINIQSFKEFASKPVTDVIKNIYKNQGFRGFYKGLVSPLFGIGLEKSIVFGTYNKFKDQGSIVAGMAAGFASTIVVSPVEYFKIIYQNGSKIKLRDLSIRRMYRGYSTTLMREFPGYAIYFWTYNNIIKYCDKNTSTIFMAGGLAGLNAWIFIYPADYIKTRMQFYNTSLIETTKKIYKTKGFIGMYQGCGLALVRAFILHSGVFLGVETIRDFI